MKHARRHGAIQHDEPQVDYGTTGKAQRARLSQFVEEQVTSTAQEKLQLTAYRTGTGVYMRKMLDADQIAMWERAAQLTERQVNAARKLVELYHAGYPRKKLTSSYGQVRGRDTSAEADVELTLARNEYNSLMDRIRPEYRHTMQCVAREEKPAISGALQILRLGTEQLADLLRLPRETFTNGKGWEG